jgi:hypothetical protein
MHKGKKITISFHKFSLFFIIKNIEIDGNRILKKVQSSKIEIVEASV